MKTIVLIILVIAAVLLASCATTGGSLFKQVLSSSSPSRSSSNAKSEKVSRELHALRSGSSRVRVQPASEEPEQTGLAVQTLPDGARVYMNGTFVGDTPLLFTDFSPGVYTITISKRGYHEAVEQLDLTPSAYTLIEANLAERVGYINVMTSPANANVTIDGNPMPSATEAVAVGAHTVLARAFGYDDRAETVEVYENQTINVSLNLPKASFRISDLIPSERTLNPLNPGLLGTVSLTFDVSTYGSGSLRVTNASGTNVYQQNLPQFVERRQSVSWDGRGSGGKLLPDGSYRLTISGRGRGGAVSSSESVGVEINRRAFIGLRSLLSGVSGLLYTGTPGVLPQSDYAITSLLLAHFEAAGALAPAQAAIRFSATNSIEIDGQITDILTSTNYNPISVGLAGKFLLLHPSSRNGLSAALTVKGTYVSLTAADTLTNFTGISVGAPVEYRLGPFGMVFMPEVIAAPYPATYTAAPSIITPSFWGYARGGLFLDFGSLVTGVSAALRTEPFSQGIGLATVPVAGGWEIHWLIPGTKFVLTGAAAGEYSPNPSIGFYGMAGVGVDYVN